jgi:hypothetical protein
MSPRFSSRRASPGQAFASLPVRLGKIALRYFVANVQGLDAFPGSLEYHAPRIIETVHDLLGRPRPPQPSRRRLWLRANRKKLYAGAAMVAAAAALVTVPWPCWHDYRVRVALFDTLGRRIEEATIGSNATGEARKMPEGALKGRTELRLARNCAPEASIHLRPEPATVHGIVVDSAGKSVVGARVSVASYEHEAVVTGAGGMFELPAHESPGSLVVLHVEKDGLPAVDQRHFAGPDPATITLIQ